jgi:cytochrome b pre-mRNA-processing protein 3
MGAMTAYDHAVLSSDAALADMLYNNIFGLNKDLVTASKLELLIAYIRREMKSLDQVSDSQLSLGKYRWGEPPTFV